MKKFIVLFVALWQVTSGMDCSLGQSDNLLDKIIRTCPRPLIDSSSQSYCCPDKDSVKCCDFVDFVWEWGFVILPFIVLVLVLSFVISCICCFCCPFCCVYKRRH